MRGILVFSIPVLLLGGAQAQSQTKEELPKPSACFYTVGNQSVEVPVGKSVCRRSPAPYESQYSLLRCGPPLNEVALVKRGDPQCDRYEDRQ